MSEKNEYANEIIYPKVDGTWVLTKAGHLYDLKSENGPTLIAKEVVDFIADYNAVVYLTRLGDVKVFNNKKLEAHFTGFFDGVALGIKKDCYQGYFVRDSKGQWYGFGNNQRGQIVPHKKEVIYCFETQTYSVSYKSDTHDSTGRYVNFKRCFPVDKIKESPEYRKYAKQYGEENLEVEFSPTMTVSLLSQLERGELPVYGNNLFWQDEMCEVCICLHNKIIYDPIQVDGSDYEPSKTDYLLEQECPRVLKNKPVSVDYYYQNLFNKSKKITFALESDQNLYVQKYDRQGYASGKQHVLKGVISIYRQNKVLYAVAEEKIVKLDAEKLAKGEVSRLEMYE